MREFVTSFATHHEYTRLINSNTLNGTHHSRETVELVCCATATRKKAGRMRFDILYLFPPFLQLSTKRRRLLPDRALEEETCWEMKLSDVEAVNHAA